MILIACCRNRRVKCDETRPECLRCVGTNRKCDFYEEVSSTPTALVVSPSTKVCPLDRDPLHEEVLMFGILRDEALSRLSGSVITKLWTHDVVQAAQSYQAVWHAGLAMAAMHKKMKVHGESERAVQSRNNYYSFSLRNYNASIKYLVEIVNRKDLSDGDRETLLIASLLFLGVSSMQGHAKEAMMHAQSGTNLYYQWEMCDSEVEAARKGILSVESLNMLIATLECTHVEPEGQPVVGKNWHRKSRPLPECSPVLFNSLSEAYTEFVPLLNLIVEVSRSGGTKTSLFTARDSGLLSWNRYKHEFGVWKNKFHKFLLSWEANDEELESVLELEMFVKVFSMTFGDISQPIEMHWDACRQTFEEIVDIGEQMYELQAKYARKYDEENGAFTLSLSPAEGLYLVVASDRDADLRRRAIELLKKWKRRNGVWDTTTMAALCETLVAYEEGSASGDEWCKCVPGELICHGHRSAWIKSGFGEDGKVTMTIRSVHDTENDLPGVTYVLP